MGITVTPQFTRADVQKRFDAFLREVENAQIEALQQLGEMCVTHARSIAPDVGFQDQTGNLRSSMGYMVFVDGVAVHSFYNAVKGGTTGVKAGESLAKEVGEGQKGVCLVVTAGMNYAIYLEAKGRDVLTSAEQLAERELPRMLKDLITDIERGEE